MPNTMPAILGRSLLVRPWLDDLVDRMGYDPRSAYAERFWLGVLGPTSLWLLRRLAAGLEAAPDGFDLPLADTAGALGLGGDGASSPFVRSLKRCCQFEMARAEGPGVLAVRRHLPPLSRRHLLRLPESTQAEHAAWITHQTATGGPETAEHRAERLARSLVELGEDRDTTEHQLTRWGFAAPLANRATTAAWTHARPGATTEPLPPAA